MSTVLWKFQVDWTKTRLDTDYLEGVLKKVMLLHFSQNYFFQVNFEHMLNTINICGWTIAFI